MDRLRSLSKVASHKYVNVFGGLLFGFNVGFVAVYSLFIELQTNCSKMVASESCSETTFDGNTCWWTNTTNVDNHWACVFPASPHLCHIFETQDQCMANYPCQFNQEEKLCHHAVGFSQTELGVFAGALIVGAMIGCMAAGEILKWLMERHRVVRYKPVIYLLSALGTLGSVIVSIAHPTGSFVLLVVARVVLGVAVGLATVVFPAYVKDATPQKEQFTRGTIFQVAVTAGIAFAAFWGWLLAPGSFDHKIHLEVRIQFFCHVSTLLSLVCGGVGFLIPEPNVHQPTEESDLLPGRTSLRDSLPSTPVAARETNSCPEQNKAKVYMRFAVAFVMSFVMQMTGINAIINFAPQIVRYLLPNPFAGNLLVMVWNFVTTIFAYVLAHGRTRRQMFIGGIVLVCCSCVLVGVVSYPGVCESTARRILTGFGLMTFIAGFAIGMAPTYYVVSQELFSKCGDLVSDKYREPGASFMTAMQNAFNIVMNVCYPILQESFSGGVQGDYHKGMAIEFFIFCGFGVCSAAFLYFFMPETQSIEQDESTVFVLPAMSTERRETEAQDEDESSFFRFSTRSKQSSATRKTEREANFD